MRAYWLSLVLLNAGPAAAADHTETIALHFIPVAEVERMLLPSEPAQGDAGTGAGNLTPEGLTAWTANPATNSLILTGKRQAIDALKNVLRLLDIPPRQIRLEVQVLRLNPQSAARAEGLLPGENEGERGAPRAALLDPKTARELIGGAVTRLAKADLPTANQRPCYVKWTEKPGATPNLMALIPRLNGEGTVNLLLPDEVQRRLGSVLREGNVTTVRRVPVGGTVLIVAQAGGPAVLVTYRSVEPDIPGGALRSAPAPAAAEGAP